MRRYCWPCLVPWPGCHGWRGSVGVSYVITWSTHVARQKEVLGPPILSNLLRQPANACLHRRNSRGLARSTNPGSSFSFNFVRFVSCASFSFSFSFRLKVQIISPHAGASIITLLVVGQVCSIGSSTFEARDFPGGHGLYTTGVIGREQLLVRNSRVLFQARLQASGTGATSLGYHTPGFAGWTSYSPALSAWLLGTSVLVRQLFSNTSRYLDFEPRVSKGSPSHARASAST